MAKRARANTFRSSAELLEQLAKPLKGVSVVGAIRADGDEHVIVSSDDASPGTRIPVQRIAAVERLGAVEIDDQTHPIARLVLKAPSPADAEIYASLFQRNVLPPNVVMTADVQNRPIIVAPINGKCPEGYTKRWNKKSKSTMCILGTNGD
jgi:hypothetical protein